jgi:hypothetical protein
MSTSKYLHFVGHLFHLAADYDVETLRRQASHDGERGKAVLHVLQGLTAVTCSSKDRIPARPQQGEHDGLLLLLESRELFQSNDALCAFLEPFVKIRQGNKESRERLVKRVMKQLRELSGSDNERLRAKLREIATAGNTSFVSTWSKAIGRL